MSRPKDIGTAAETAVARYLQANGWPNAERRALAGAYDLGDITGTPGLVWEVKGGAAAKTAGDGQVDAWLDETWTESVNARADFGVLVMQRAGFGPARAGRWWAVMRMRSALILLDAYGGTFTPDVIYDEPVRMHLSTMVVLLRNAGYGTPLTEVAA